MPVFNTAAAVQPLPSYLDKKALRAGIAQTEAQTGLLRKQTESYDEKLALEQAKAGTAAGNLQQRISEGMKDLRKEEREGLYEATAKAHTYYQETGDQQGATDLLYKSLDPYMPGGEAELRKARPDLKYDPEVAGAMLMTQDEFLQRERPQAPPNSQKAEFISSGKPMQGYFVPSPDGGKYYDSAGNLVTNAQPIAPMATQESLGVSGSIGDEVTDRKMNELVTQSENMISGIDRAMDVVDKSPQTGLGFTGKTISFVDNAVSNLVGLSEAFGGYAEINGEKVPQTELLNENLTAYQKHFTGALKSNASLRTLAVSLAFQRARSLDPSGRVSDKDVALFLGSMNLESASKVQIKRALRETKLETLRGIANAMRVKGYNRTEQGKETYDNIVQRMADVEEKMSTPNDQIIPTIGSDDEYDKLESGQRFYDPDGVLRVKP